ncbi:DEKNAAC104638 [Brettanomyces naardenensis]|uniref:DEKNAAC104638 n=1 Tax=Brettanomyces naardenensis TaxID=13370 RepID=A0A448YRH6_BRENA|nr:DEKNAAC104638 [Brettanomyces naardenensis]
MVYSDQKVPERVAYWSPPENRKRLSHTFKWISIVSLLLLYGSSLLVSQVNAFYRNFHELHQFQRASGGNELVDFDSSNKTPLSLSLVRNGTFSPERREIQWIETPNSLTNDSGNYVLTKDSRYILKSVQDPKFSKLLYQGSKINYEHKDYQIEDVVFSDDLNHVLLICDKVHNWRHSFFASYFIYDIDSGSVQALYDTDTLLNGKISLAKWAPDSKKIALVLNNNVYIKDISDFEYPVLKQITYDGGAELFYGKPDWVYEEEVFESDTAMWWSPNSEFLALLRLNDTNVPEFPIPYFVQEGKVANDTYPELRRIKYPKAGYPNPVVDFLLYSTTSGVVESLADEDSFYHDEDIPNETRLITEMVWVGDSQVLVKTTNRESDILKVFIIEAASSGLRSTLSRSDNHKGTNSWFEIEHNTLHIPKSPIIGDDGYIDVVDVDGYDHLAYFSPPTASVPKYLLTSGKWEVTGGPAAFDYVENKVYFLSTERSSVERHLYSVNLDGSDRQNITDVSKEGWYSVSFSKGSRYLLLNYDGPQVPYQTIIDLHEGDEEELVSNTNLKSKLHHYALPESRYGELDLGDGVVVNYKETLPLNFDPHKQYPLLFFVYGGPGSQLVQKTFSTSFSSIVAAELGAVVVTVDGRGTGFKGKDFRNVVRDNLSYYEVKDQISAGRIFSAREYIDADRTAIWGWSYGGFMTLRTLEEDHGEVFRYGMAVAPVTNFVFYDSIYTERYMHTPQENPNFANSSVHSAEGFRNVTRFLLMHGTGDDNVHFQNSLKFLDMLDLAGVENYDLHVFPDSDHSISYHNANVIVYDKLFRWLKLAFTGAYVNRVDVTQNTSFRDVDPDVNLYG